MMTAAGLPGRAAAAGASIDLRALAERGTIHFVGISGAGMAALAELVLRGGGRVSGSDLDPGVVGESLAANGATVRHGHDPAHIGAAVAVVATSAVPHDHPELVAARERGIPILKRAQALGALVNDGTVVAIAGTHGKTTTTAMTTAILEQAGLEPTGFIGGRVGAWGTGLHAGGEQLFVVEADEFDRSFLTLQPHVAVVTSIEADHLDTYGSIADIETAFTTFVDAVPTGGLVAGCIDDAGAARLLATRAPELVMSYGTAADAALRAVDVAPYGRGARFTVTRHSAPLGDFTLGTPGVHNVRNALGALAAALHVGASLDAAVRALTAFRGVARRFQEIGVAHDVVFIDDYAHHPTEVAATLATARSLYAGRRIVALFQPHLYSRTQDFADAFGQALSHADAAWITDVFAARERPIPGVSGALIADATRAAGGGEVRFIAELADVEESLRAALRPGDVCVAMGAGNIDRVARRLYAAFEAGAGS
jgi:UDP-N-acetylmuramate--alanine ligase